MTLQEIQDLTIEDCVLILRSRLELAEDEEATVEQLEAELVIYKQELTEAEEARLAEVARIDDLKARFDAMEDKGLLAGASKISNPLAYFNQQVLKADKVEAESMMVALETAYQSLLGELNATAWLDKRKSEYAKIDSLLLEALAEKEAGRPEKMEEYLALREQIKFDNPKP